MTDMRTHAPTASGDGGFLDFLREARQGVGAGIAVPALLLLLLLTGSNIVLLLNIPAEGERLNAAAALAGLARVIGLLVFLVPLVRILARSARPAWKPDGAFFLFILVVILSLALGGGLALAFGDPFDPLRIALRTAAATIILAPLAPWIVGVAAAVPLAAGPGRFLRDFGRWLPPLLFWSLLLVTPLAWLHAMIDIALLQGRIEWFWTAALADGVLSTLIVILTYALHAAAYRRVARG
jgi:hypothetical protein